MFINARFFISNILIVGRQNGDLVTQGLIT